MRPDSVFVTIFAFASVVTSMAATADTPDFNRDIRPLFKNRCVKCHGPLRQEGKLNLSLAAGVAHVGESGVVIVPGQLMESRL